jgi:hypothetical protein
MVVNLLDPTRTKILGLRYSSRAEYLHIQNSQYQSRPPKDLAAMYPFCELTTKSELSNLLRPSVDPIIIDDNVGMWPLDQQDQIIVSISSYFPYFIFIIYLFIKVVRESKSSKVWSVDLSIVQSVLQHLHTEFFKQVVEYDKLKAKDVLLPPPSTTRIYKEFLRSELSRKIAGYM